MPGKSNSYNYDSQGPKISFNSCKILAILSSIATMVLYAETMLIPAIPHLINDFSITYSTSSWILSSYLISGAISVPIAGKLSDMYGRKRILLIVMIIYTVGVIGGAVSTDIYSMLISRTVQGIGMSVFAIVFAIVQDQFPRHKVAIAQGTLASMFAFGGVLGLLAGGNIIEHFGWRATFYSVIPVAVLLIIIILQYVRVKELTECIIISGITTRLDIKGAILLAITITSFLSALTLIQPSENTDLLKSSYVSREIVLLCFMGSVSLAAFIIVERKASSPLIDFKLIAHKPILISNIIVIIWGICTFAIFQTIPILVQSPVLSGGIGGNAVYAANIQLPFSITSLIFGPTSGFIISRIGSSKVTLIGAVVTTVGLLGLLIFHTNAIQLAINLATMGVGLSLLNVGQLNINSTSVPSRFIGLSLGINTLLRYIGSAIGPTVAGMFMQTNQDLIKISDGISEAFPSRQSYDFIFMFILILAAITIFLSVKIMYLRVDKIV